MFGHGESSAGAYGQDGRLQRADTVSAFLIAAAAVSATLFAADSVNWWLRSAMLLSLASVGFAIASLFPRSRPGVDEKKLLGRLDRTPRQASQDVADALQQLITEREKSIRVRLRLIEAGLMLLATSITCVVLAAFGIQITIT